MQARSLPQHAVALAAGEVSAGADGRDAVHRGRSDRAGTSLRLPAQWTAVRMGALFNWIGEHIVEEAQEPTEGL